MQEYQAPCYTFEEAREILGLRPSELSHAIRVGAITPVAYTKKRQMLLFSHRNKRNYGHATCTYQGHLTLPTNHIRTLLDGEAVELGPNHVSLLDPEGILDFSTPYPFKRPTPREWLYDWNPIDQNTLAFDAAKAIPLPKEGQPTAVTITKMLSNLEKALKTQEKTGKYAFIPTKNSIDELQLDFFANGNFMPEDLRVSLACINNYQKQKALDSNTSIAPKPDIKTAGHTGNRENQLHTLITRLIKLKPNIPEKAAWEAISQDCERDQPLFDTDYILNEVTNSHIEWNSKYDKPQTFDRNSFAPLLSKLKNRLKKESDFIPG